MKHITSILIFAALAARAGDVDLWIHWSEAPGAVGSSKATFVLARGRRVKGRLRAIQPDAITLDNGKTIKRGDLAQIRIAKELARGRVIGSATGAALGAALAGNRGEGAFFFGSIGFLIGWATDRTHVVIGILK